ncbi:AAA family ATPase [Salegentibacter chungangensis]|uniref:AAA family ATPase n=1 Tax=Salegentibacter chungangensis TaxID=1335724 RepID=A0ABW3NP07_9FLAO
MEEKLAQRSSSCIKVVLFGPESTGKTTLSRQLARHYDTLWVEEYMREYLQEKWDKEQLVCQPSDIIPIARGQMARENELSAKARDVLICDTDLLELKVYSEAYYEGFCDPLLLKHALNNQYHVYFLTYIDVPWTPDDLRDKPNDREGMFEKFETALQLYNKPYTVLKGNLQERLETAVSEIDKLIKKHKSEVK